LFFHRLASIGDDASAFVPVVRLVAIILSIGLAMFEIPAIARVGTLTAR
jgi:hypothetical protein